MTLSISRDCHRGQTRIPHIYSAISVKKTTVNSPGMDKIQLAMSQCRKSKSCDVAMLWFKNVKIITAFKVMNSCTHFRMWRVSPSIAVASQSHLVGVETAKIICLHSALSCNIPSYQRYQMMPGGPWYVGIPAPLRDPGSKRSTHLDHEPPCHLIFPRPTSTTSTLPSPCS